MILLFVSAFLSCSMFFLCSVYFYILFYILFLIFPLPFTTLIHCRNCGEFSYWNRNDYVAALTYCGSNCVNSSKFALYSHASLAPGEISTCLPSSSFFLRFSFYFFNILKTFYDCQRHCGKFKRLRLQLF